MVVGNMPQVRANSLKNYVSHFKKMKSHELFCSMSIITFWFVTLYDLVGC
jgi:hypothetical protein